MGERGEKIIDFLGARRRLITEHGTTSRGARSHLLDPIRRALGAPDIQPLFEQFIFNPDRHHDLIRNLAEHHAVEGTPTEVFQALAHLGVERLSADAVAAYDPAAWERSVELARAGAQLAASAGDWMSAENVWLRLDERAADPAAPSPALQRRVMYELAGLLADRGDTDGAIEFYLLCEKLAGDEGDAAAPARIRVSLGRVYLANGAHETALESFTRSAEWAAAAQDVRLLAEAELGAGTALAAMNRHEEGLPLLERALARAALSLNRLGRHDLAAALLASALRLPELADDLGTATLLLYNLFDTAAECGAWGDFLIELTALQNTIHRTEQFQHLGPVLIMSAKAHTERGLFYLALHNLEEAAYLYQALGETDELDKVNAAIEQIRALIQNKTE